MNEICSKFFHNGVQTFLRLHLDFLHFFAPPHILPDQLTLFQQGWGTYYAHYIISRPPGFSNLPSALI